MNNKAIPFWEEAYQEFQFKSYTIEDEHPNVPKHLHASNKIVARKIRRSQ